MSERAAPVLNRSSSASSTASIWWLVLGWLLLIIAIVAVFGRTFDHSFIAWDDQAEIYSNPDFNPVTWSGLLWNWTHTRLTVWMPLTYTVWGGIAAIAHVGTGRAVLDPTPFHAACVLFHFIAVVLLFFTIRKLIGKSGPALVGTAVFALHPLQVEPVAWASGMYTVLSSALAIGALYEYLRFIDAESKSSRAFHFVFATILFIAGMLTKPSVILLPIVITVVHMLLIRRRWRRWITVALLWTPLAIVVFWIARTFHGAEDVPNLPLHERFIVAGNAAAFYLGKMVQPVKLIPDYGAWPAKVLADHSKYWLGIIPAALVLAALASVRLAPRFAAAVALFLVGLAPYLGFVKFDYQFYSTVADRYAYLALTGLALLIAAIVARWPYRIVYFFAIACAVAAGMLSFRQVNQWRDTETLFNYTLTIRPDSLVAHRVLGTEHMQSDPIGAEEHFKAAIAARPDDATAHKNYGDLLSSHRRIPAAAVQYGLAVHYDPNHYRAMYNLGVASQLLGEVESAKQSFMQSIEVSEKRNQPFAPPHQALGEILLSEGLEADAKKEFESALQISPDFLKAQQSLARLNRLSPSPSGPYRARSR